MCYSFRTSIISYILGISSAIFAILTKQIVLGVLILAYSQMQLTEMLIWYGIDTENENINRIGTSYGKYLLATHNFAIGLGILLYISCVKKDKLKYTDFIPIVAGILFFIFVVCVYYIRNDYEDLTYPLDRNCSDTTNKCQNPNNRLKWSWPHHWYIFSFIISIIILVFYIEPFESKCWMLSIFGITFLYMLIFNTNVMGSLWCFSTAILAPLIVIVNYFLIKGYDTKDILT